MAMAPWFVRISSGSLFVQIHMVFQKNYRLSFDVVDFTNVAQLLAYCALSFNKLMCFPIVRTASIDANVVLGLPWGYMRVQGMEYDDQPVAYRFLCELCGWLNQYKALGEDVCVDCGWWCICLLCTCCINLERRCLLCARMQDLSEHQQCLRWLVDATGDHLDWLYHSASFRWRDNPLRKAWLLWTIATKKKNQFTCIV